MRLTYRYTSLLLQIVLFALLGGTLVLANSDWRQQSPIPGPGNAVVATAATPDGTRAATITDDGHVSLWGLNSRTLIRSRHLPYGKPHHIAIRNQGDAIAVAYEDADAVIWWCDGSDKLILPNVRARLVAFAHEKRIFVTVSQSDNYGDTWDIDSGKHISSSSWSGTQLPMPFLTVLPSDSGAVVHETSVLGNSRGFGLQGQVEVYPSGSSSYLHISNEPPLMTKQGVIVINEFDGTNVSFAGIPRGGGPRAFLEHGSNEIRAPVCLFDRSYTTRSPGFINAGASIVGTHLDRATAFTPTVSASGSITHILTGNSTGDLVAYRRTQPGDWIKHPAPWLMIPVALLLGYLLVRNKIQRRENPPPKPQAADAAMDLPRVTLIAAWITMAFGVLWIIDTIYDLTTGTCMFNLAVLALPAGWMVRKRSNGWRIFAAILAWIVVSGGAIMLGVVWIGKTPLQLTLGQKMQYLPMWAGVLCSLVLLGFGVFMYLSLTHPLAVRICRAARLPSVTTRVQRIAAMSKCPTCGYNTAQTVIDDRHECPECGEEISFNNMERDWLVDQQEQLNRQR